MATRLGVPRLPAPSTGLAPVLSTLILLLALAAALPAGAAAGKHRGSAGARAGAGQGAQGAQGTNTSTSTSTAGGGGGGASAAAGQTGGEAAEEQAEADSQAGAGEQAKAGGKAKRERERQEREQRRREREARKEQEGNRETRKERKAREAREAEEALARERGELGEAAKGGGSEGSSGTVQAGPVAVAASSPSTTSPATKASGQGDQPPTILAQSRERPSGGGGRGARRGRAAARHKRAGATAPTTAAATASQTGLARPRTGTRRSARPAAKHAGAGAGRSSALGRTVTLIVGVIPTWLWGAMACLGLLAAALGLASRASARRARRLAAQREALLEDVGLLQAALLPELPARLGPVATTAAYRPASGPGAGGDFYDVFALPGGLIGVIVGDVSGHGRGALPQTTLLRFTLRAYLEAGLSPREALRWAAPVLERQLEGSFATVVLASYDPRERLLRYSCAGHPHPVLTGLAVGEAIIACSAPPIGAGEPTGTRETVVSIPGGTLACFYTDGIVEARRAGELYGADRLAVALESLAEPERTAEGLLELVRADTDSRPDDMAACLLGVSGGQERPRVLVEELVVDEREAGRARAGRFLAAAGVQEGLAERLLEEARAVAAEHGRALLRVDVREGGPRVSLDNDNVAPLRAGALMRDREAAL